MTAVSCRVVRKNREGKAKECRVAWLVHTTQGIQPIVFIKTHSIFTRNNIIPDMQL